MAWNLEVVSALLFSASGILALLAGIGWRRRRSGGTAFAVLMVAVSVWAATYGIQLGFSTKAQQLPWQRAALAVSATVPPALLAFAYQYSGGRGRLSRAGTYVLVGEAAAFAGLALTNPYHHLVWKRATLESGSFSPVLDLEFAVGYYLHILVAYLVVAFALWIILSVYFRSASIYRKQSTLLLAGAAPAFASHVVYTAKASPIPGLDLTPFAFVLTGVAFGSALFRFDLLERTPIARQRAIELTGDGLLVVDSDGTILDSNRVARQLYDVDAADGADVSAITGETDPRRLHGETTTGVVDGFPRTYDVYVSELASGSEPHAGFSVVLRDVTDRIAYEQRLEVAYRVLRHNLRNEMNVITGNAAVLADDATTRKRRELAEVIRATGEDLVELSEKARRMVDLEWANRDELEEVDVVSVLESVLAEFREEYPAVAVTVDCPDEAPVAAVSRRAVAVALRNVLENAPEHNDVSSLSVDVVVTTRDRQTRVEVSDTGSGMPADEREILRNRHETPLRHSSGIGLWLVYWIVSTSGGEVSIETSDETGTTVTLAFASGARSE